MRFTIRKPFLLTIALLGLAGCGVPLVPFV